jgi:hypothetical protein
MCGKETSEQLRRDRYTRLAGVLGFSLGTGLVTADYFLMAEGGGVAIDPFMALVLSPGYLLTVRWAVIPTWMPFYPQLCCLLWLVGPVLFASTVAVIFVIVMKRVSKKRTAMPTRCDRPN